jgi:hypothetical protein
VYNPAKLDSAKVRRKRTFAESSFEFGIAVKRWGKKLEEDIKLPSIQKYEVRRLSDFS